VRLPLLLLLLVVMLQSPYRAVAAAAAAAAEQSRDAGRTHAGRHPAVIDHGERCRTPTACLTCTERSVFQHYT
jgi:hypothetical protein